MTLKREQWEQVAQHYDTMQKPEWAERIRQALAQSKRVNIAIDLAKLADYSWRVKKA